MKVAVVLFNLGGPNDLEEVNPFLFNLFNDSAILRIRQPLRRFLAWLIARRRTPVARKIYAGIGGKSPILDQTRKQAIALTEALRDGDDLYRVFVTMRYSSPGSHDTVAAVKDWGADRVVLMPLYPQFSTTTTESSLKDWDKAALKAGLAIPTARICCYFDQPEFIAAHVGLISQSLEGWDLGNTRVLFSAHGLPETVIKDGDPYQWQVEKTVAAVAAALPAELDYRICYQSRVGPMKWIGPSTEEEIRRAGDAGKALVVVPIAFVSEHSETLYELDLSYHKLAQDAGVPAYRRVPALAAEKTFITALATMVTTSIPSGTSPGGLSRCPAGGRRCIARPHPEKAQKEEA